jgi:hypothetical protein
MGDETEFRPPGLRLRQGLVLLVGALVFAVVTRGAGDHFYLTPLGLGRVYLLAAVVGGRRGGNWATARVRGGWGAAVVWAQRGRPDLDLAGLYLLGAGVGATVGALLARRGFVVDPLGLAATILLAGLLLALASRWPQVLEESRTYALLVGLVGVANVVAGLWPRPGAPAGSDDAA